MAGPGGTTKPDRQEQRLTGADSEQGSDLADQDDGEHDDYDVSNGVADFKAEEFFGFFVLVTGH